MGQTPRYGLRWPEPEDPAQAWTAVGNLAADVETMYRGAGSVPTAAAGWAWYGGAYGQGIELRAGRVITIDGLLKRTGTSLTLTSTPVPILTAASVPDGSRSFTGALFMPSSGQVCRWYIAGGTTSLGILHPGGGGTYTFATNSLLAVSVRWVMAAS